MDHETSLITSSCLMVVLVMSQFKSLVNVWNQMKSVSFTVLPLSVPLCTVTEIASQAKLAAAETTVHITHQVFPKPFDLCCRRTGLDWFPQSSLSEIPKRVLPNRPRMKSEWRYACLVIDSGRVQCHLEAANIVKGKVEEPYL